MAVSEQSDPMRIGALAERAGVTTRTVRYYESLGLLPEPDRRGAHRSYSDEDVDRLGKIEMYKDLGLTLEEVADVLLAYDDDGPAAGKRRVAAVLRTHLEETDRKLAALRKARKELVFRIALCEAYAESDERRRRGR